MSSSTMMNGPSMPRASHPRTAVESATIATTHAHAGTARRRSATEVDLAEPCGDLARGGRAGLDPDLGGRVADVAEDVVGYRPASRRLLECRHVEISDPVEGVLPPRKLERGGPHGLRDVGAGGEQLESSGQHGGLVLVHGHLQSDIVRQLREPANVADDERLAERERANRGAGGLAHRRRTEIDVDVGRGHQPPEPVLRHVALPDDSRTVEPEALEAPVEVEAGRGGSDEEQRALRAGLPRAREGLQQLWRALARVDVAEGGEDRIARDLERLDRGHREGGMRHDPDRAVVARGTSAVADVARVHDQPGCEPEHLAREREVLRPVLPQRRDALLHDGVAEQPRDKPPVALERIEICLAVAAAERDAGDQVMEDEVVEHDDSRGTPQRVEDPAVCIGIVSNMVNDEVDAPRRALRTVFHGHDLTAFLQRREQQRRVVRDSRAVGRHRAEERHLHESSLPMARSHVTSAAIAFPARPKDIASSGWSRSHTAASPIATADGSTTRPVVPSWTTSSGPPASVAVITGLPERNDSYGPMPKSSSTGA